MTERLQLPAPTWFVGCGNMAGAILEGWRAAEIDLSPVTVIRPSGKAVDGVRVVSSVADAGPPPKLVVLGFKPQKLNDVAPELRQRLSSRTAIVSMLAGVQCETLRERFPGAGAIIRAMPNLSVAVRRGVTGLFSSDLDEVAREEIGNLFSALGFAMWMADEGRLAALGSVAGAGPAYVARFIAALTKAGVNRGLSEEIAATIARETVLGTVWMAATTGEDMASIAKRVASPKGTTEAGLAVLDGEAALDDLIAATINAAFVRGLELADEARGASLADAPSVH